MRSQKMKIARMLFWDAILLLSISAYEFVVRVDAMWGPLRMFVRMAVGERIPLARVMTYVDFSVFETPLFLLLCGVMALWVLFKHTSRRVCTLVLIPCTLLAVWGFSLDLTLLGELVQVLKLLPLLGCLALCLARTLQR